MVDVRVQLSKPERVTRVIGTLRAAGFTAGQSPSSVAERLNLVVIFRVADDKVAEVTDIVRRTDPGALRLHPRSDG